MNTNVIVESLKKPDNKRTEYQQNVAKYTKATGHEDVDWKKKKLA